MGRQYVERTQDFRGQIRPVIGEQLHQAAPAFPVRAEDGFGLAEVALEDSGGRPDRVKGGWSGRGKPLRKLRLQRERNEKRGARRAQSVGGDTKGVATW